MHYYQSLGLAAEDYSLGDFAPARLARADLFDPGEVSVIHGINRCVPRWFLGGADPHCGPNYDHRKAWRAPRVRPT